MKILGVGVDIVANQRFARLLGQPYAPRFLSRVLHSPAEFEEFHARRGPEEQARYLASRWALKEAVVKATGARDLVFSQMWLAKSPQGTPSSTQAGPTSSSQARMSGSSGSWGWKAPTSPSPTSRTTAWPSPSLSESRNPDLYIVPRISSGSRLLQIEVGLGLSAHFGLPQGGPRN